MMTTLLGLAILAVLALSTCADDVKPCYNWDRDIQSMKESCVKCKKEPSKADRVQCMYEELKITDEEGNVLSSKIRESFLYGLDDKSKTSAIKKGMKDCGKDKSGPLKTEKDIFEVYTCCDKILIKVCPEAKKQLERIDNDKDFKGCLID